MKGKGVFSMKTLKELFRYQNVLKGIFEETRVRLGDRRIFTETKETHKYSGRNEKKKDETVLADEDYKKSNPTANELIACLIAVSQEREKVSLAIAKAKKEMEFAMDAQMELNHVRQDVASVLSKLNRVPASVSETKQGRDFVFNEEGNQVPYIYDIQAITTIDFDRKKVQELLSKYQGESDDISMEIERIQLNTTVDIDIRWTVHSTFNDVIEEFKKKAD